MVFILLRRFLLSAIPGDARRRVGLPTDRWFMMPWACFVKPFLGYRSVKERLVLDPALPIAMIKKLQINPLSVTFCQCHGYNLIGPPDEYHGTGAFWGICR
jgi:hypothetical protein